MSKIEKNSSSEIIDFEQDFDTVFKEYYSMLIMFANKFTKDIEESKEIVQGVFVKLYEKRNDLNIDLSSLKSYLFRMVHNRCINLIQHHEIRRVHQSEVIAVSDSWDASTEKQVSKSELEYYITAAIKKLPQQCKKVFELSRWQGLSNNEIAQKEGVSVRTIENHISKALKMLRENLKDILLDYNYVNK